MFIFKINIRQLTNTNNEDVYYLTDLETDLLSLLSNNCYHSYKDISNYIYKYCDKGTIKNISILKHRLEKRTDFNLKIITIRGRGYILEEKILIE